MRHLKSFFEAVQTHQLEQEDLEDELLEIIDAGWKIEDLSKGYYNPSEADFQRNPKHGYLSAYSLEMSGPEEDYDVDAVELDPSIVDKRTEIEKQYQEKLKILNVLKATELRLKCQFYIRSLSDTHINIRIIPTGTESIKMTQKDTDFYDFIEKVKGALGRTLSSNHGEYLIEADDKTYAITITFNRSLSKSRFDTANRNVDHLKSGIAGRGFRWPTRYDFSREGNFQTRVVTLTFKGKTVVAN